MGDAAACTLRCDAGDALSCAVLGLMYLNGDGVPVDDRRSAQLFRLSCGAGVSLGCGGLGSLTMLGRGVVKDVPRAIDLYVGACDNGDALSCDSLAAHYASQNPLDNRVVATWLEKSCALGRMPACGMLAALVNDGALGPPQKQRVLDLRVRACQADLGLVCAQLADMYARGDGVPVDTAQATTLYQRACALGAKRACR